jgi:tetratricopeptide (TPR) repeat protein
VECLPLALLLEWGVAGGLAVVLALGLLVTTAVRNHRRDSVARQLALLAIAAAALQGCVDHWWAYAGVTVPAAVLGGSLVVTGARAWPRTPLLLGGAGLSVAAAALTLLSAPHAWSARAERNRLASVTEGDALMDELSSRPLDGRLHGLVARAALRKGDLPRAVRHAHAAAALTPGSIDAHLLLGAALAGTGDSTAADRATARALELLPRSANREVAAHLIARYPDPEQLARLGPTASETWSAWAHALLQVSPAHAAASAAAREAAAPEELEAPRLRVLAALASEDPALALHLARLLAARRPELALGYQLAARALAAFPQPRVEDARTVLHDALAAGEVRDPAEVGILEEALARLLLSGDATQQAHALELATRAVARPAPRDVQSRRRALLEGIRRPR